MLPHDSSHAGRIERGGFREWRKREFPEQEGMEARKRFCPVEFAGREGFLLVRCVSYAGENRSSRRALKKSWRKSLTSTQKFTWINRFIYALEGPVDTGLAKPARPEGALLAPCARLG